jgi:hypothetical protein
MLKYVVLDIYRYPILRLNHLLYQRKSSSSHRNRRWFHRRSRRRQVTFCQESSVTVSGTCQQLPGASALRMRQLSVGQSRSSENARFCIADTSWDEVVNALFVFLYSSLEYFRFKRLNKSMRIFYMSVLTFQRRSIICFI